MRLVSNFSDYYDAWFDRDGPEFRRMGTEGLSKQDQFKLLVKAGYQVPPHGLAGEILDMWWEAEKQWVGSVVVYTDPMAHTGDGKEWRSRSWFRWNGNISQYNEVYQRGQFFASAYLGGKYFPAIPSCSWRLLQVGPHQFWIEYWSDTDWRSNCGEGGCKVIEERLNVGYHETIQLPLFAIDFVIGREMYAIDFNTAPGIRGSGVERLLLGKAAVKAIEDACYDMRQRQTDLYGRTSEEREKFVLSNMVL